MSWWIITFDRIFNLTIFRWQFALEVVNSTKSKEIWSIAHSCSWKTGKWSWELYPIRADQGQGMKINCYFSMDPKLGLLLCFFPSIVVSREIPFWMSRELVAHKILVTAQVLGFGLDFGLGLVKRVNIKNFLNLYCGCSIKNSNIIHGLPKKLSSPVRKPKPPKPSPDWLHCL